MPRPTRKLPAPITRVKYARRIANQAINEAAIVASDLTINRSTRTRQAYKVKAEALDKVALVLAGKSIQ